MIGILSTDKPETRTHDQQMLDGLIATLGEAGYHLVFVRIRKGARGRDFADARFDGLVIDYHIESEELEMIHQAKLPAVIINAPATPGTLSVMPDHRLAGALAARHALQLGHRRLGFIQASGSEQIRWPNHMVNMWREGIDAELRDAGISGGIVDLSPQTDEIAGEGGYLSMLREVLSSEDRPTFLIGNNPYRTVECTLQQLASLGLSCPDDLSVLSMGDEGSLRWCQPTVSSIRLPYATLGKTAAQVLLRQIEEGASGQDEELILEEKPGLVVRDSTRRAPEQVRTAR
ncbi:LacI family DNA-binding transcriptional regulator [Mucisphaera calidilacus]|nr:LacI family DNA-binding transcriptional regulator [Mucisphaera calidilacus]